ncbi:MAG: tyrosine-type recombinase/integrase [Shewanella sp.]
MAGSRSLPPRTPKEVRRLLQMIDDVNPIIALMLEFSALSGLRYSDVGQIKKRDVMINGVIRDQFELVQQKPYHIRLAKGAKQTAAKEASKITVYLTEQCKAVIEDVMNLEPRGVLLFESSKVAGKPYTIQYINRVLKAVAVKQRLTYPLSSHSFRKSYALMLVNNGAAIHQVRDALGHSSIAITDKYLSGFVDESQKLAAKIKF